MFKRIISLTVSAGLLLQQTVFAGTATLNLAGYLSQGANPVVLDRFRPVHLKYFSYSPATNDYQILLDKGDFAKGLSPLALSEVEGQGTVPDQERLKETAGELMRYFLIGVTLPDDKFWVNLRPDSEDQIIDDELAQTDLGKVMLEADLKLKQDTALFTSPQTPQGKAYWDKLYQRAGELFGSENITIPTLTRPWIVPGEIILRESAGEASGTERAQASRSASTERSRSAYIYKAALKVMLEEDYLKSPQSTVHSPQYNFSDPRLKELNQYSTQLIRELILPKLTQKVNSSKDYAELRQVYFSLILARWFKDTFKGETRNQSTETRENSYIKLIDSKDLTNLSSKQAWDKTTYFKAYKKSFKEGEYNLSEPVYTPGGQVIRRYMSGGASLMVDPANLGKYMVRKNVANSAIEAGKVFYNGNGFNIPASTKTMSGSPLEIARGVEKYLDGSSSFLPLFQRDKGKEIIYANLSKEKVFSQTIEDLKKMLEYYDEIGLKANLAAINLAQEYNFSSLIIEKFVTYLVKKARSLTISQESIDELKKSLREIITIKKKSDKNIDVESTIEEIIKKGDDRMLEVSSASREKERVPSVSVKDGGADSPLTVDGVKEKYLEQIKMDKKLSELLLKNIKPNWLERIYLFFKGSIYNYENLKTDIKELIVTLEGIEKKIEASSFQSYPALLDYFNSSYTAVDLHLQKIKKEKTEISEYYEEKWKWLGFFYNTSDELELYFLRLNTFSYERIRGNVFAPLILSKVARVKTEEEMGGIPLHPPFTKGERGGFKKGFSDEEITQILNQADEYRKKAKAVDSLLKIDQEKIDDKTIASIIKFLETFLGSNEGINIQIYFKEKERKKLTSAGEDAARAYLTTFQDSSVKDFAQAQNLTNKSAKVLLVYSRLLILFAKIVKDDKVLFNLLSQVKLIPILEYLSETNADFLPDRKKRREIAQGDTVRNLMEMKLEEKVKVEEMVVKILNLADSYMGWESSSPLKIDLEKANQVTETSPLGGIDLTKMKMLIQPQGSFASSSLDFSLPMLSRAELESFDLDKELTALQRMASSGIAPHPGRFKEDLAICFAQGRTGREIDRLKSCLEDVLEQHQLEARETPNGYKEVLVVADTRSYVLKEGRF